MKIAAEIRIVVPQPPRRPQPLRLVLWAAGKPFAADPTFFSARGLPRGRPVRPGHEKCRARRPARAFRKGPLQPRQNKAQSMLILELFRRGPNADVEKQIFARPGPHGPRA